MSEYQGERGFCATHEMGYGHQSNRDVYAKYDGAMDVNVTAASVPNTRVAMGARVMETCLPKMRGYMGTRVIGAFVPKIWER